MAKPPPRMFVEPDLSDGLTLPLDGTRWHYLHTVLRLGAEEEVILFNGRDGEWQGTIEAAERRRGVLKVTRRLREQSPVPDLTVIFAPLKKDPTELIIQKGTELGAQCFQPVITGRTILAKNGYRPDRLEIITIEAAEQCERLDLPDISELQPLCEALNNLSDGTQLIFCDEAGDASEERWGGEHGRAQPMLAALATSDEDGPWALLIGPEGGFTPEERNMLRARADTIPVSLGPRILKAETAAIAAMTLWQAARGDFR